MTQRGPNWLLWLLVLAAPYSALLGVLILVLLVVPASESLVRETGARPSGLLALLVDHRWLAGGAGVALALAGIVGVHAGRSPGPRIAIAILTSFPIIAALLLVILGFWELYAAMIESAGG